MLFEELLLMIILLILPIFAKLANRIHAAIRNGNLTLAKSTVAIS